MTALPGTMPYFPPHSLHESATTTLLQQPWNYVPSMTTTFPPSPSSSSYSSASSPYPSTRSSSFSDEYRMSPASSSPAAVPLFHPRGTMYTPVPWAFPDVERSGEMTSGDISSPPSFSLASSQDSLYSSGGHISSPSTSPLSQSLVIKRSPSAASSPEREISPATNNPPPQLRPAPSARTSTIVSPNDEDKTEPYAQIIYRALMSVPDHKMILADIYKYFQQHRPRRASRDGGWKNSIRHNLSMNGVSNFFFT